MTVFGPVRVRRLKYGQRGVDGLCPGDAALNLPEEKHSHGLCRLAAEQSAKESFDDAVAMIARHTGAAVAKRQVEQLAAKAACDFEFFYAANSEPEQTDDLLVLSIDGKGILMRPEHLREQTRQRLKVYKQKLSRRQSRGEKHRKRMAIVASVYTIDRYQRTAESVMKTLAPVHEADTAQPRARNKRMWASVAQDVKGVVAQLFDEALQRDPDRKRQWVILVDGDERQLRVLREVAQEFNVNVDYVLDFGTRARIPLASSLVLFPRRRP